MTCQGHIFLLMSGADVLEIRVTLIPCNQQMRVIITLMDTNYLRTCPRYKLLMFYRAYTNRGMLENSKHSYIQGVTNPAIACQWLK